jgi:hypothetical protein
MHFPGSRGPQAGQVPDVAFPGEGKGATIRLTLVANQKLKVCQFVQGLVCLAKAVTEYDFPIYLAFPFFGLSRFGAYVVEDGPIAPYRLVLLLLRIVVSCMCKCLELGPFSERSSTFRFPYPGVAPRDRYGRTLAAAVPTNRG